jgi:FAD/FMN-containing dehydrogenase
VSIIRNFGRNLAFRPRQVYVPRDEAELLRILREHRGERIRAMGRLHSWSEAAVTDDVLVDLRHFHDVRVEQVGGETWATVGAGCQIKRILNELDRAGLTLPTLGLITEQTIAGAAATGTHGSGRNSVSHYLEAVRVARYDDRGEPVITTIDGGAELRAARCGLGCTGIVTAVRFRPRPAYRIEEHLREHATLDEVLAAEEEFPLQQFYLVPWRWTYLGQHRRESSAPRSRWAWLYRWYWLLGIDVVMHLVILLQVRIIRSRWLIKTFSKRASSVAVVPNWRVVDRSQDMLVMEHELFRHFETEIFVRRSQLPAAMEFLREVLMHAGGEPNALSPGMRERLAGLGLLDDALALAGRHVHHYVICLRKVLPDDAMLSPAGGGTEPTYAVSLISFVWPAERAGFIAVCNVLVHGMARLFGGRPHWGKYCPLTREEVRDLYPECDAFVAACQTLDPAGVFRNQWVDRIIFNPTNRS